MELQCTTPDLTSLEQDIRDGLVTSVITAITARKKRQTEDRVRINIGLRLDGFEEAKNFTKDRGLVAKVTVDPKVIKQTMEITHRSYWPYNDGIIDILVGQNPVAPQNRLKGCIYNAKKTQIKGGYCCPRKFCIVFVHNQS